MRDRTGQGEGRWAQIRNTPLPEVSIEPSFVQEKMNNWKRLGLQYLQEALGESINS